MRLSASEIVPIAQSKGFDSFMIEKVIHLFHLLNMLNSHPYLKNKFVLKGGSAINLFYYELPRLSIDIDLNYIFEIDRDRMIDNRPKVEKAIQAVLQREDYVIKKLPNEHAGGKWRIQYMNYKGQTGNLEIDLNYMFRIPLWNVQSMSSFNLGDFKVNSFYILDIHELAAGKMAALFSRHQARDLFDVHKLLTCSDLNMEYLRTAFIVYGAFNRKDWRTISLKDIEINPKDVLQSLSPVLQRKYISDRKTTMIFVKQMINDCCEKLSNIITFSKKEKMFLDEILTKGNINPSLITDNKDLQDRINRHPLLQWKAKNVREFLLKNSNY